MVGSVLVLQEHVLAIDVMTQHNVQVLVQDKRIDLCVFFAHFCKKGSAVTLVVAIGVCRYLCILD